MLRVLLVTSPEAEPELARCARLLRDQGHEVVGVAEGSGGQASAEGIALAALQEDAAAVLAPPSLLEPVATALGECEADDVVVRAPGPDESASQAVQRLLAAVDAASVRA